MDWSGWITALVALYGALLSTHNLVSTRRDKRRRVKVELSTGFFGAPPYTAMLFIQVSNPGHIAVMIQPPGIRLPKGSGNAVFPNPASNVAFPHELCPGRECRVWTPRTELADLLKRKGFSGKVKLMGYCVDAVGTTHKSKRFQLDLG